jgi:hypothetical protein
MQKLLGLCLYCNTNDKSYYDISVDSLAPVEVEEYMHSLGELLIITKKGIVVTLEAVVSEYNFSSGSESDSSSDNGSSVNDNTDDDFYLSSYINVTRILTYGMLLSKMARDLLEKTLLDYSHSRNPTCVRAHTHRHIQALREPLTPRACWRVCAMSQYRT